MSIQACSLITNTPAAAQSDELECNKKQFLSKFKYRQSNFAMELVLDFIDSAIRKATKGQDFIAAKVHVEVKTFDDKRLLAILNRNLKMERGQEAVNCLLPVIMDDSLPDSVDNPIFNGLFDVFIFLKKTKDLFSLFRVRYGVSGGGEVADRDWSDGLKAKDLKKMAIAYQEAYETQAIKILNDTDEFIEGCQPKPEQKERKWCAIA